VSDKSREVFRLREVGNLDLTPRGAISDGPRIVSLIQECRSRLRRDGRVERFSSGDDLYPATVLVSPTEERHRVPPLDHERAFGGPDCRRYSERGLLLQTVEKRRLPTQLVRGHIDGLQHGIAHPPRSSPAAGQKSRLAVQRE